MNINGTLNYSLGSYAITISDRANLLFYNNKRDEFFLLIIIIMQGKDLVPRLKPSVSTL